MKDLINDTKQHIQLTFTELTPRFGNIEINLGI